MNTRKTEAEKGQRGSRRKKNIVMRYKERNEE